MRQRVVTKSLVRCSTAALIAAALWLTGCGSTDSSTDDGPSAPDAVAYVIETQKTRGERVDMVWISKRLVDYLPNVSVEGAPAVAVLDTVVVGEVVDAEAGAAYKLPEGDPPDRAPNDGQSEVPFDSVEADWKTIHATVKVSQDLSEAPQESEFVTVGFAIAPSIDAALFMDGLHRMGPAVFFASSDNAVFDYDETVSGVAGEGTLVATVGQEGTLALPFITDALADEFLSDSPDLDTLIQASLGPARTIAWP